MVFPSSCRYGPGAVAEGFPVFEKKAKVHRESEGAFRDQNHGHFRAQGVQFSLWLGSFGHERAFDTDSLERCA